MAINIGTNTDGEVTYQNPPVNRVLFPNIREGASLEEIQAAVDAWLDEHPEATTTVQDGSILPVKLDSSNSASDGYVLSYNATTGKFEWYDIEGELNDINSELGDLKEDLNQVQEDVANIIEFGGSEILTIKYIEQDQFIKLTASDDSVAFVCGNELFDGEWESGTYGGASGLPADNASLHRNKNKYIPIPRGSSYLKVLCEGGIADGMIYFYGHDKSFISYEGLSTSYGIRPPVNAEYFNFRAVNECPIKIIINESGTTTYQKIETISVENSAVLYVTGGSYVFSYDTVNIQSSIKTVGKVIVTNDLTDIIPVSDGSVVYGNQHVIDLGLHLNLGATQTQGVYYADYVATSDENIYKVFISQTLPVLNGNQTLSAGYNSTLWVTFADATENKKLLPVLAWNDMLSTDDSFYYDGSKIWVHCSSSDIVDIVLAQKSGFILDGINVHFKDLTIRYPENSCLRLINGATVECENCNFEYSGTSSNVAIEDSDGVFIGCKTFKARYDGFGITTTEGQHHTEFIDCVGYYCYDDGISHHNAGCTFNIVGGEYHHNHKGGVASPCYGSTGRINGVYSHDNRYGVYAIANSQVGETLLVNACLLSNNMQNLVAKYMDVIMNKTTSVDYTMWADEILDNTGTLTIYP